MPDVPKVPAFIDSHPYWVASIILGVLVVVIGLIVFAVRRAWCRLLMPSSAAGNRPDTPPLEGETEMNSLISESQTEQLSLPIPVQGDPANKQAFQQGLIVRLTDM